MQHVEQPVTLDPEHQIELAGLLVGQRVADLDPGGVQQDVDVPAGVAHLGHHLLHRARVGEVDAVVVGRPARLLDGPHRGQRGLQTLEARQLPLDQHRCRALAPLTHPGGQFDFEPFPVLGVPAQVGVGRVGLRGEVEQVERATPRRGQVGGDRRHDAAGGAGDEEDRIGAEHFAGLVRVGERALRQADTPAPSVGVADLDAAGIAQGLVDQHIGQRCRLPA